MIVIIGSKTISAIIIVLAYELNENNPIIGRIIMENQKLHVKIIMEIGLTLSFISFTSYIQPTAKHCKIPIEIIM